MSGIYRCIYSFLITVSLDFFFSDAEMQAQFTLNQSRAEEITMREDYGCQLPPLNHDEEGFGDLGFGDSGPLEMIRDGSSIDHSLEPVLSIFLCCYACMLFSI